MSGLNKVQIIGRLGRDPESKSFQNGGKVVNLRVATSESWRDKQSGEKREKVEWHQVAIFNEGLCDVASRYLRKGSQVYLEGKLQTRKWTDNNQVERYTTEIVLQGYDAALKLLDAKDKSSGTSAGGAGAAGGGDAGGWSGGGGTADDLDDDVPF